MPTLDDRLFPPPVLESADATEQAVAFHIVARATLYLATAILPILIIVQPDTLWRGIFSIAVVDAVALLAMHINRKGRTRLASHLYLGGVLTLLTINALSGGGIRSPGVQFFLVFVLLAGLLLGERAGVITAIICGAIGFLLVVLEVTDQIASTPVYGPAGLWLLLCIYIGVALLTMRLATQTVRDALSRAKNEIAERREAEKQLGERVKELRLLHDASVMLHGMEALDPAVMTALVNRMTAAWLHPDDCRARILYQDHVFASRGWAESPWRLAADFQTSVAAGKIEVVYVSEHPDSDEGPFLTEERDLINSLAELLRSHMEEVAAEQQRRGLEQQLREAQKMEALGTLAGGIAHDFNNILTAIGGNAEVARMDLPADSPAQSSIEEIVGAQARARDLVQRILLFSRRQTAERRVTEIQPVVEEALRLLRASLPAKITIEKSFSSDAPPVAIDTTQLHQVMMNLGTNAGYAMQEAGGVLAVGIDVIVIPAKAGIHFTPTWVPAFAGMTDATVETSTIAAAADLSAGEYVRVSVRDTGTGMAKEVRDRLFEPFFTTKGHAGTGLGLSVVHGIVRDHEGAITVESEVGRGTVFHLYFPAAASVGGAATEARNEVIRGAGEHIMYVDDEASLAYLMSRTLSRLGYRCTEFTDAQAALHEFRTAPQRYDAVISDLQMPGMSGYELLAAIRSVRADIPVAIASGVAGENGNAAVMVNVWISKPSTLAELSAGVRALTSDCGVTGDARRVTGDA